MTGLPNLALFLHRLEHALARASREGDSVAVLLMDLNQFKVINDSLGHDAGDAVLVEVAERLLNCVRPGDKVGRIFAGEFRVLLEASTGVEEARQVAERIREGLRVPFNINGPEVFLKASIGIASDEADANKRERIKGDGARNGPGLLLRQAPAQRSSREDVGRGHLLLKTLSKRA